MRIVGSEDDLALSGWEEAPPGEEPVFALGDVQGPWPVDEAVFDLEPPPDPRAVLVVAPEAESIAEQLTADGARAFAAPRLTLAGLRAAAVVVLIEDGTLPVQAMAVLAARRVLITDPGERTFGLQSGIEFLRATHAGEAIERANMAVVHPRAMAGLRAMGARAAGEHRASLVYPRLAADLHT